jgi:hypothetical protein
MGDCRFCGQPVGFMRWRHSECQEKFLTATKRLPQFFEQWAESDVPPARFRELAENVARNSFVSDDAFRSITIDGFRALIDKALSDHLLTEEEENKIRSLLAEFGLTINGLPAPIGEKFVKCAILRDLDSGRVPDRVDMQGNLPLNLVKGEKIVWVFQDVTYFTVRTKTKFVGGSHGVSIRVMPGLYYRVGAFKGEPVKTEYLSEEGAGNFVITSRAVYFVSAQKTFKIAPKKIVSVEAYSDAICITRDAASAKPQIFKVDDPWFAANVITRLDEL